VALACALGAGCAPAPPNVVIVSFDTLRADHLSAYGYARETSPEIDRLAAQGVRFARAYAPASWTLPSHVSLFTSQLPSAHGVRDDRLSLPAEATTLAELLSAAGFQTAGFVSWVYVGARFGLGQGFDVYRELVDASRLEYASGGGAARAGAVVDEALRWLADAPRTRPFFLFVHLFDPHIDYAPPPPYDQQFGGDPAAADGSYDFVRNLVPYLGKPVAPLSPAGRERLVALYDGEIRYADAQLGRLLRALEARGGECLVIVLSDHGEEFGEHGSYEGHGWTLYDEVLHVPLVLRLPHGEAAGTVVEAPVTLLDVAPSVLEVLGLPAHPAFEGQSLLGLARGEPAPRGRLLFAQTDRAGTRLRAVRGERFKWIEVRDAGAAALGLPAREGRELYDLASDPGEQRALRGEELPVARYLASALEAEEGAARGAVPVPVELSDAERERLRALGYAP
jgi:arylsulfatase A-like enzyme